MGVTGVRARLAVLVGLVVALLSGLGWQLYADHTGSLVPQPPVIAMVLLVVMAAFVAGAAWPVRRYLHGSLQRLDPIRAARTVVLAQAAALTGAAAAGWYAGQLAVAVGGRGLQANQARLLPLSLAVLAAVLLAAAGLLAQRWCRIEPPRDDDRRGHDERHHHDDRRHDAAGDDPRGRGAGHDR